MDEKEYQSALKSINSSQCVFEKALFTVHCECKCSQRFCLADRQGINCTNALRLKYCTRLLSLLRKSSRFLMHKTQVDKPIPHNQEIKIQLGGLLGVQIALLPECNTTTKIQDIGCIVGDAYTQFDAFQALPMSEVVQVISRFDIRRRKRR